MYTAVHLFTVFSFLCISNSDIQQKNVELCFDYKEVSNLEGKLIRNPPTTYAPFFSLLQVVEGAAGAAVAAYTNNLAVFSEFSNVAIVICGANMTSDHLHKIMLKYGSKEKPVE